MLERLHTSDSSRSTVDHLYPGSAACAADLGFAAVRYCARSVSISDDLDLVGAVSAASRCSVCRNEVLRKSRTIAEHSMI